MNMVVKNKNQCKLDILKPGTPSVFYCVNEDKILDSIVKLYSSQPYLAQSSNILFCTKDTQLI